MARKIRTSLRRDEVKKLVRDLPGIISGRLPSQFGIHKVFWGAVAHSFFTSVHTAFIIKSAGGVDDLGNRWDDLEQSTKAYHRPVSQGNVANNIRRRAKDPSTLGLLTPAEHAKWKKIFGIIYYGERERLGESEAKALAGQTAWTRLKDQGAMTKWEVLGNRDLLILRNTDTLYKSVRPGAFNPDSGYRKGDRNQVFILQRGKIIVGTSVKYANVVGSRKGVITRPIWPAEIDAWLDKAVAVGRDAAYERIARILER